MRCGWRYVLLSTAFKALAFLTSWLLSCPETSRPATLPLDDWDIPQLAAHLKRMGVEVRTVPTMKSAVFNSSAFLTVTEKEWSYLNGLRKTPDKIQQWRGIVYCSRETPRAIAYLAYQWEDRCLRVGPFIFYGDASLLARIAAALHQDAPASAS